MTGAGYRQLARIRGTLLGEAAGVIRAAEVARQGIGATDPRFVTVSAPAPVRPSAKRVPQSHDVARVFGYCGR